MDHVDDERRGNGAAGVAALTAAAPAQSLDSLAPGRRRGRRAAPWMALAVVALLAGLWAGLVLLGLPIPAGGTDLAEAHGPLMALAFLGTLIGVERAVALRRGWAYLCPVAAGVGGLATAAGAPLQIGPALLTVAGERLELSRMVGTSRLARGGFIAVSGTLIVGWSSPCGSSRSGYGSPGWDCSASRRGWSAMTSLGAPPARR